VKSWERLRLKPGEVAKLDEDLLIEKKANGRIVIYEVVDESA